MVIKATRKFRLTIGDRNISVNPLAELMPRINGYCHACSQSSGKEIHENIVKLWLLSKSGLYVDSIALTPVTKELIDGDYIKGNDAKLNFFLQSIKLYSATKSIPDIPRLCKYESMDYNQFIDSGYWQLARQARFMQDKYKCKKCNANLKSSRLNAHHKSYNNRGWEIETNLKDLITLCCSCHATVHKNSKAKVNQKYFK